MFKDFYEHQKRVAQDNSENRKRVLKVNPEKQTCTDVEWQNLQVGDFVKIKGDEMIAADLLLLQADSATCFVDTCNLDGETSLKSKTVLAAFNEMPTTCLGLI